MGQPEAQLLTPLVLSELPYHQTLRQILEEEFPEAYEDTLADTL